MGDTSCDKGETSHEKARLSVSHKCYISFKTEDIHFKQRIQSMSDLDIIDKSLDESINSNNEDYILQVIRSEYLADSTVTIHLIGLYGAEVRGMYEQRFIKRELQSSLYSGADNSKNGILGIVLPEAQSSVYKGRYSCSTCGGIHNLVAINNNTTVSEFSYNYYIPNGKCAHTEEERYCVLTPWESFVVDPNSFVETAFDKRLAPIASKTKVRP